MSREAPGFERRQRARCADCAPCIVDHTVAEVESKYEAARRVVFNDAAKIDIGFCTGGPFVRKNALAWFWNAEWITAKMNEAWSSLQEDSCLLPTLSSLHTKESLQMISARSWVPRQEIDFRFEVQERKSAIHQPTA